MDAKRAIGEGISPAIEKQREKRRLKEAKSFGEFGEKWLTAAPIDFIALRATSVSIPRLLPKIPSRYFGELSLWKPIYFQ